MEVFGRTVWAKAIIVLIFVAVILSTVASESQEINLQIPPSGTRCVFEDLPVNVDIHGEAFIADGNAGSVVLDVYINKMSTQESVRNLRRITHEVFTFQVKASPHKTDGADETVRICFIQQYQADAPRTPRKVAFRYSTKRGKAINAASMGDAEQFKRMSEKITDSEDAIINVLNDMNLLASMEQDMFQASQKTGSIVLLYSIFACLVLVLVGGYQYYATKKMLKHIKLV